jgi:hypothetical protein
VNITNQWNPLKDRPRPTIDCLIHEALLVQSWKKSHDYIRTNNWYADILELDISTATLPAMIQKWRSDYSEYGADSLKPGSMRVVPAPKSWKWQFDKDTGNLHEWHPVPATEEKPLFLRPLAHLDIKSQSLATGLMLCLADLVESVQGNPDPTLSAGEIYYQTVSYGNRLFCDWENNRKRMANQEDTLPAQYRWGNANCYRKFFTDYQHFLERPKQICKRNGTATSDDKLAVISLDLTGFYDFIDVEYLIERLITLCEDKGIQHDVAFWDAARAIMKWSWHHDDQEKYGSLDVFRDGLPRGLPQGLVASGFFSNVAMLDFDNSLENNSIDLLRNFFGKILSDEIKVLDYCRYVDDMRLVINHTDTYDHDKIKKSVTESINKLLEKHCPGQKCNNSKTDYIGLESIQTKGSDAILMKSIQTTISGPMDSSLMEETSIVLEGLMRSIDFPDSGDDANRSTLNLAKIHQHSREVRDDTIIRFVSYRQLKMLRARRDLLGDDADKEAILTIDAEIELAARKMVDLWARDPSLVIVLKHSLKLYPSLEVINAVIESCKPYLVEKKPEWRTAHLVVSYVISDIIKFCSIELLQQDSSLPLPNGCSFDEIRKSMVKLAKLLLKSELSPWYLKQQASMALIVLGEKSFAKKQLREADLPELRNYRMLAEICEKDNESSEDAIAIVARQLYSETISFDELPRRYSRHGNRWLSLGKLIESAANPFGTEHASLRLIEELLHRRTEFDLGKTPRPPSAFQVKCSNWEDLGNPLVDLELEIRLAENPSNELNEIYDLPNWADSFTQFLMSLGMLGRAAFIGSQDYTQAWHLPRADFGGYRGIKSSWAKRRYGMFQRSDGLAGPSANCSSWFSELIAHLLPWPGVLVREDALTGWSRVKSSNSLLKIIRTEQQTLATQYCKASGMPAFTHHISQDISDQSDLTVVMIQTVRPLQCDYKSNDLKLSRSGYKKIRRDHLAGMLRLTESHLNIRRTYAASSKAHITILPELSVHEDDLDLIERYVDRTRSIVFCGLVFHDHPKIAGELVNSARWIIPDDRKGGRSIRHFYQGKKHMMETERRFKIKGYRPHQLVLRVSDKKNKRSYRLTGCLCYDATDLDLASDLRNQTDFFIVAANNRDVATFDNIAVSLNYLMYQHYAIINSGEFGGTLVHAPYKTSHERILVHHHGGMQAAVSIAKVDLSDWLDAPNKKIEKKGKSKKKSVGISAAREMKAPPAGYDEKKRRQ